MRLLVYTPVFRRPEITEAYCLGISRLRENFDLEALCVLSPEDETGNLDLMEKYGINYTMFKNKLGAKKNHGLNVAMEQEFDYLVEMNSDDIIANELFDVYASLMAKGESFIGVGNFVFYNSVDGKAKECKSSTLFGIGRAYSKEAIDKAARKVKVRFKNRVANEIEYYKEGQEAWVDLDRVDGNCEVVKEPEYRLWDDEADRGMDNHSEAVFRKAMIFPSVVETEEPLAIDVKSSFNLWSFDQMSGKSYDAEKFFSKISDKEVDYIKSLRA